MTRTQTSIGSLILLALLATLCVFVSFHTPIVKGSAPSGLTARIATTSNPTVTSTAGTLIATTTNCAARVISTTGSAVMLTFSDYIGQTPTASFGYVQPASTTVAYDAGIYGCGLVKVYSFATQVVTVSETF